MNTSTILLLERIHEEAERALSEAGLKVLRHDAALQEANAAEVCDGSQVIGIRSKSHIDSKILAASPHIDAIGCFCIGTNQVDLQAAAAAGVAVFNSPFSNTRSVAEMTIAEIIALHRRLFDRSMQLHQGQWQKSAEGAHEVRGRTLGIVGYGHIGSQVSVLAEALGMRVCFHDILPRMALGNAEPVDTLGVLLERADVVTLHVPATPSTHHLMGAEEMARMKPGATLINNARGSVVDLEALGDAISRGHLGGAALDVFPEEPGGNEAAFTCPLAGLPNVLLTPHVGGSTEEAQAQIGRDVASKIIRFLQTGTTTSAVNVPEVDLPSRHPEQMRILYFHRNVPGVLSNLHSILADLGANIHAEYLQSQGDLSYVILDVDPIDPAQTSQQIMAMPETIRLRML